MKYTIRQLFEVIDEVKDKNEFFYDPYLGDEGADYFIGLMTNFSPREKEIIRSDCHEEYLNDINLGEEVIDVDGLLVFERMAHEEDYNISRVESIGEVEQIILGVSGITNMFTSDIVVLENGKRKKYSIKDKYGKILNTESFCGELRDEYFIEWIK